MLPLFVLPVLILVIAWRVDCILGEPQRYHPLVCYGKYVTFIEKSIRRTETVTRYHGLFALLIALLPALPFLIISLMMPTLIYWLFAIVATYFAMSYRGLCEHTRDVLSALSKSDIAQGRTNLAKIVSRDTSALNETEISSACIESVLENGNDAIFAAWFWWLVAGIPGIIIYRMVNTLDAMWGYKNERYIHFGWAAARLDDLMNYLPARTTALCYCLAGDARVGWRCWRRQGQYWKSPNAGPVMAAGAGSLNIQLGGAARYHGSMQSRPDLGAGKRACQDDIARAIGLVRRAMWIWLVFAASLLIVVRWLIT